MVLKLDKTHEDVRGKILFFSDNNRHIHVIETRKGYARGGHYHKKIQEHIIIYGKFEYREEDIKTGKEKMENISTSSIKLVESEKAHLFIALEDSMFIESYEGEYEAENYPKYRKQVEDRMNKHHSAKN